MTEKEKQMCRNIAAIMRVKRLGVIWIAPQARMRVGVLEEIIAGRRKVSGEEAARLAEAMGVPYETIYANTVEEAVVNQFTPRKGRRIATSPAAPRNDRKKGW